MDLEEEKQKVIDQNPKHRKCTHCGHEEDIYAAAAIPMGNGNYNLIFGSDADFCTNCEEPWEEQPPPEPFEELVKQFDYELANQQSQATDEDVKAATERYPGIPLPLAVAKYMMDKALFGTGIKDIIPGMGWGGIHLETVGRLIEMLVGTMSRLMKKGITITIRAEDYPESYDHLWVEVKEVDVGTEEEAERFPLTGWPCCGCGKPIPPGDADASYIMLRKKATWDYPTWGNMQEGIFGGASAALCGECMKAGIEPDHALKKDGGLFVLVPLSELEDMGEPEKRTDDPGTAN